MRFLENFCRKKKEIIRNKYFVMQKIPFREEIFINFNAINDILLLSSFAHTDFLKRWKLIKIIHDPLIISTNFKSITIKALCCATVYFISCQLSIEYIHSKLYSLLLV